MSKYENYKSLHEEVKNAIKCPKCSVLKDKIDSISNSLQSLDLDWDDDVKSEFDNFVLSCISILSTISSSIASDFQSAENAYNSLSPILDSFEKDDKTYAKLLQSKPSETITSTLKDGSTIEVTSPAYTAWKEKKRDLEQAFSDYIIAIQPYQRTLSEVGGKTIAAALVSAGIQSSSAPVFTMPVIQDTSDTENGTPTGTSNNDIFTSDGSPRSVAYDIWKYFKNKGLSDIAVAGILGNVQAECDFDPDQLEDNNRADKFKGYGIIQWTNYKGDTVNGRRAKLERAAQERGVDKSSLAFQCDYLWEEAVDPNSGYGKALKREGFYGAKTPEDAAYIFHDVVENSDDSEARIKERRQNTARNWYNEFSGTN